MTDIVDKKTRSRMMSGIKGKNTRPEKLVRSYLHRKGLRFRLHARELPGRPDVVLPKYQAVVFVNGCFWHQHEGCRFAYKPGSNRALWDEKLRRNVERDAEKANTLRESGWRVFLVWECQTRDEGELQLLATAIMEGGHGMEH